MSPKRLDYPVHFVAPNDAIWPELRGDLSGPLDPELLSRRCIGSLDNWIVRTCYELRLIGEDVSISTLPKPGAINIGDIYCVGRRNRGFQNFFVIPRADGHVPQLANFVILQNNVSSVDKLSVMIPHWVQPNIIRREPSRGNRIEVLSYKGLPKNLDPSFWDQKFRDALSLEGVKLEDVDENGARWSDYSQVDVVFAIRNMTKYDASGKPASKLVNAWWGEAVALLGPEPAFGEIGREGLDHVIIRTPEDVVGAIRLFRAEPARYVAMIKAGKEIRGLFNDRSILERWILALNGPIGAAFEEWKVRTSIGRSLSVAAMVLREPRAKKIHQDSYLSGERILD